VALSFPVKICKREAEVRRGLGESNGDCLHLEMAGQRMRLGVRGESSAIHGFPVRGGNAYLLFVRSEQ